MDLVRIASRVAAGPVKAFYCYFEGNTAAECVDDAARMPDGPLWITTDVENGWLAVTADPVSMGPDTPVEVNSAYSLGINDGPSTWGQILDGLVPDGAPAPSPAFRSYPSMEDFLMEDSTIEFLTSFTPGQLPELVEAARDAGFDRLAEKADLVQKGAK